MPPSDNEQFFEDGITRRSASSQSALNCKKAAQKSGFTFACARLLLFPTKRARCAPHRKFFRRGPHTAPLCGGPDGGAFLALHRNIAVRSFRCHLATCFVKAPFRNAVTYDLVRSLLRKGLFRASHPNAAVRSLLRQRDRALRLRVLSLLRRQTLITRSIFFLPKRALSSKRALFRGISTKSGGVRKVSARRAA